MIGSTGTTTISPSSVMRELMHVLSEARRAQRETELAHSEASLSATEDRARHAREKADAARYQALLQFSMNAGSAASSIGGNIGVGCASERAGVADLDARINRDVGALTEICATADEAFGFGHRVDELDAEMELDASRSARFEAYRERAGLGREDLDEILADARQVYRDLNAGGKGGA